MTHAIEISVNLHLMREATFKVDRLKSEAGDLICLDLGGATYPGATIFFQDGQLAKLRDVISDFLAADHAEIKEEAA